MSGLLNTGYTNYVARKKKLKISPIIFLCITALLLFLFVRNNSDTKSNTAQKNLVNESAKTDKQPAKDYNLQPTIDQWAALQQGKASIVVYDLQNQKFIGAINPETQYFTASIYKLFVAYEGYLAIQNGKYSEDDPYLTGYTRGQCLDAMIRDSYSPCAEKMWNELGKETITNKLKTYGIENTSMSGLYTTAQDVSLLLKRLYEKKELNQTNTAKFLDSMKNQDSKYRRGLPAGFADATVYNKVGWNEDIEWHDASIVTIKNGNSYIIVVLTKNIGSANIAKLGSMANSSLK